MFYTKLYMQNSFMKKEIKDTKGEIGRKMLGKQLGRNLTLKKEIIIS